MAVDVRLTGGGTQLPPPIKKRMQASIYTIADNVLIGRQIDEIAAQKAEYEQLVQEVFDRILMGYTVEKVAIDAGRNARIAVVVSPWQDVIQAVAVEVQAEQMPRKVSALVLEDVSGVETVFEQILLGLPVDAAEWTNGIMKNSLQEFLAARLPEFWGDFEITADKTAKVRLKLYPKGALIRSIDLSLRSESIPNLALIHYRPSVQQKTEILLGVPVAFAERHKAYFSALFTEELSRDGVLKSLGVTAPVYMEAAPETKIHIDAVTDKYHVFIEGYLDINKREENTSARIHAGKKVSPVDEVFLETDFFPHQMKWVFLPGISRQVAPGLLLGYKYNLNASRHILWAKQKLGGRYSLRLEHTPQEDWSEVSLRYQLHDFLAMEYVLNEEEHWLRMVGIF